MTTSDITITFDRTRDEAIKARLDFYHATPGYQSFHKFGPFYFWIIIFIVGLLLNFPNRFLTVSTWGQPDPRLTFNVCAIGLFPVSALIGYGLFRLVLARRDGAIRAAVNRQPDEVYGIMTVTVGPRGIVIQAPVGRVEQSWALVDTLRVTSECVHLCHIWTRIYSIPRSALGERQAEFVSQVEKWLSEAPEPPPAAPG